MVLVRARCTNLRAFSVFCIAFPINAPTGNRVRLRHYNYWWKKVDKSLVGEGVEVEVRRGADGRAELHMKQMDVVDQCRL